LLVLDRGDRAADGGTSEVKTSYCYNQGSDCRSELLGEFDGVRVKVRLNDYLEILRVLRIGRDAKEFALDLLQFI
jgi:hypothetical protein